MVIGLDAQSSVNELHIGSNTGGNESPTQIDFYTATAVDSATNNRRMRITSAGNVGIGTDSPNLISYFTRALSIQSGSDSSSKRPAGLEIAGTASGTSDDVAYIELMGHQGATRLVSLYATHEGATDSGKLIIATSNAGSIAEKLSVDKAGDVTVSTGNLVIGTNGKGIDFSANTGDAAGMTSELLDDYEEGTWTVVATMGDSGTVTMESGVDLASYTKIGRMVNVHGYISINSVSSPVGILYFSLPFATANLAESSAEGASGIFTHSVDFAKGYAPVAKWGESASIVGIIVTTDNDNAGYPQPAAGDYYAFNFSYHAAT
jgi:hypothetical protein